MGMITGLESLIMGVGCLFDDGGFLREEGGGG